MVVHILGSRPRRLRNNVTTVVSRKLVVSRGKRGKTPRKRARKRERERTRIKNTNVFGYVNVYEHAHEHVHVSASTIKLLVGFASLP